MAIIESLLELVGGTSLVRLRNVVPEGCAEVWAKTEQQNPGGSVKDRICVAMLDDAALRGRLQPGGTVVEATSGNTGIGLALACAARGYKLVLAMPESMSLERRALLSALGAKLLLTPEAEQMDGAIRRVEAFLQENPKAFQPSQFDNAANPAAHEASTAKEILDALAERNRTVDAFVAAVGTGGTISGTGRSLRRANAATRIIAVEPESCATISRGERGPTKIQGIAAGFVPRNYDPEAVTEVRTVTDREAWEMKKRLAREEGLLVGISAGANVAIACKIARELGPDKLVVTVLCDTGERYFSLDTYFDEASPAS